MELAGLKRVKVVVEPDDEDGGVLVLLPDGQVVHRAGPAGASCTIKSWSARNVNTVIVVEWRGGLKPPAEKRG